MNHQTIYFVGTEAEVDHHAAPLHSRININIVSHQQVLESARAGDLAIFFSEHFDRFRNCCQRLKQMNVATLYMLDGILEWRNAWENRDNEPACPWAMRPAIAHKVACIGWQQAVVLNSWGNSEKTEIVGVPRFDQLQNETTARPSHDDCFRLLIMTAKCPGFTDQQVNDTVRALSDLDEWFRSNPRLFGKQVETIWRLTGNLAERINVENRLTSFSGPELVQMLGGVDAVISTPSTAILEAMLMKKPVATLDYGNSPVFLRSAWSITSPEQITPTIRQILAPSPAKLLFQETMLNQVLANTRDATGRMIQLISRMLEVAAKQLAHGDRPDLLCFPAQMLADLPLDDISSAGFDHAALYPNYNEFYNQDVIELQTQLAHARREINHLQEELTQLQAELGQAHEIFEQIHQHPLAGPIVRARQKLLDLVSKYSARLPDHNGSETTPSKPRPTPEQF